MVSGKDNCVLPGYSGIRFTLTITSKGTIGPVVCVISDPAEIDKRILS